MGEVIIRVPENVHKEYFAFSINQLETLLLNLEEKRAPAISQENWKKELLQISQWTDSQINEIRKAREYINIWKPKKSF
jgi:hypothetical protein